MINGLLMKVLIFCRGDTPFCSEECKQEQIEIDEAKEKNWNLSSSMKALRKRQQRCGTKPRRTTLSVQALSQPLKYINQTKKQRCGTTTIYYQKKKWKVKKIKNYALCFRKRNRAEIREEERDPFENFGYVETVNRN